MDNVGQTMNDTLPYKVRVRRYDRGGGTVAYQAAVTDRSGTSETYGESLSEALAAILSHILERNTAKVTIEVTVEP